ncbi:MAG: metallophosphoesterase [Erysipelotrichaceae bacterium]|nr:metallophosphoesterase [Erysipelotrichaceae bacterium]MBQ1522298.1 metallophosphoesterase [Erysipelotrichaceae bacterium]
MKKKLFLILGITTFLLLTALFGYLNASKFNLTDYEVTYLDIKDDTVPESFMGKSIIFISDLEYGTFFDKTRLELFKKKINSFKADVIVFGGDMFDKEFVPISEDVNILTDLLSGLEADLGKFAILGDFDQITDRRKALVSKILYDSNFELLDGNPIQLHNNSSQQMNLIGINYSEDTNDLSGTYSNVQPEDYTITIIHGAAMADILPIKISDLTISGHSHHCQVNFPFFIEDSFKQTGDYATGKYKTNNTLLYVSKGVGTTIKDYRLFSDPEILYITFKEK